MDYRDILSKINDLRRQVEELARLDVAPLPSSLVTYSGTPTSGQVAQWAGGGTITQSGYAGSAVALLTGRGGGQALIGGTASGNDLTLESTSHATKGDIIIAAGTGVNVGDDVLSANTFHIGTTDGAFAVARYAASANGPGLILKKSRDASVGNHTVATTGDEIGKVIFQGSDGSAYQTGAQIVAKVDGAPGASDMPGRIEFQVSPDGSATPAIAVVIKNNKSVIVGGLTSMGANVLGVKAGTSSNDAAVGGVLYSTTAQTGNVGTGEDDLATYTVPANTLSTNGQSLWFEASGTFTANANSKTLRARFGTSGTNLLVTRTTTTAQEWIVRGRIFRTGAATQKAHTSYIHGALGSGNAVTSIATGLDQTLSGSVALKITGEGTSTNDIVCESLVVGYDDANT